MRITQGMLSNNMLRHLGNSYERMGKYQDQLSTGKKITRPSDDPVVAMKGMNYRTQLNEVKQFQRNLGEIHNWMENSDSAMDKATQAMQRVRELTVQASNGTYDKEQRENIAKEISQLRDHLIDIANTKVNNKYIFNGNDTLNPPIRQLPEGQLDISENKGTVNIEISKGNALKANVDGGRVFSEDLFRDLKGLEETLSSGEGGELNSYLNLVDGHINNIVDERADLGARMNRVELVEDRLAQQEITATKILSDNEDADLEKVITNLKTQESVHRAALGVGARIIQPTLMDFLR
ncbi:flagellar hook-associated protein 3 [Thalassobacillus devorans]|uniref:Flagellar hook-associated protein 3 n=1 Tax=Thalassobacillus devorans TaxID=279813 RepID=A0ABQ1NRB6_9BACI|nr:flagellar hook-associated protein FlgL [Thalassobacillus devorans]NIK28862.1 flagellar hook-associated protein 3 FlgL [Thalassobacillus devorans]GGC83008.1 flagellar hook-associated protein 3 [Thalassobacillus devorans]